MFRKSEESYCTNYSKNSYKGLIYLIDKAPPILKDILDKEGWVEHNPAVHRDDEWNLCWRGFRPKPSEYKKGKSYQKFNHFPKINSLGSKDLLCRMIK